jgi:microcystin-dependent protein
LNDLSENGFITHTADETVVARTIAISGNGLNVSNANGVAGNPTISLNIGTASNQIAAGDHTHANLIIPPGTIMPYAGNSAPSGYFLCNGAAVSRTSYAALFSAIGINYGTGNGTTTFNIPNLQGRVPVGYKSSEVEYNSIGKTGGEKTHILSLAEMPNHSHTVDPPTVYTSYDGLHAHSYTDYYMGPIRSDDADDRTVSSDKRYEANKTTANSGEHRHSINIPSFSSYSAGSGNAHNNLQPYLIMNYIIKY